MIGQDTVKQGWGSRFYGRFRIRVRLWKKVGSESGSVFGKRLDQKEVNCIEVKSGSVFLGSGPEPVLFKLLYGYSFSQGYGTGSTQSGFATLQ